MMDFFETTLLECIFERVYKKSRDLASLADLDSLKYDPSKLESIAQDENTAPNKAPVAKVARPAGDCVCKCQCALFLYDPASVKFLLQTSPVDVEILRTEDFSFVLLVTSGTQTLICQPIDSSMNPVFNAQHHSFIWVYVDGKLLYSGSCFIIILDALNAFSWSIQFLDKSQETLFQQSFAQASYETMNKVRFDSMKAEDQSYVADSYYINDVEMGSPDDELESDEEKEDSEEDLAPRFQSMGDGDSEQKNSQLAVGFKDQRSYVVRGSKIGVFKNDYDDIEFSTAINHISTPKGKEFRPDKVMLHDQDSKMVLFNAEEPEKLYQLDLEYGKVVEEWNVDENREIEDFTHDAKYSQMTAQKTFVGISHNALFRIDPRLSGSKVVQDQLNQYNSKNQFSCTTTTGKGDLVVASNKGEIRLYDKIQKRAKTQLPGFGGRPARYIDF
jgi:hypothetical protein